MARRSYLLLLLCFLCTSSLANSTTPKDPNQLPAITENDQTQLSRIDPKLLDWKMELIDDYLELVVFTKQESAMDWERIEGENEDTRAERQEEYRKERDSINREKAETIRRAIEEAKKKYADSVEQVNSPPSEDTPHTPPSPSLIEKTKKKLSAAWQQVKEWYRGLDIPKHLEELGEWRRALCERAAVRISAWTQGVGWTRHLGTSSGLAGWVEHTDFSPLTDPSRWRMPSWADWESLKAIPWYNIALWGVLTVAFLPVVLSYFRPQSAHDILSQHKQAIIDEVIDIWAQLRAKSAGPSTPRRTDPPDFAPLPTPIPLTPISPSPYQLNPSEVPPMPPTDPFAPGYRFVEAPDFNRIPEDENENAQPDEDQENNWQGSDAVQEENGTEPYIKENGAYQFDGDDLLDNVPAPNEYDPNEFESPSHIPFVPNEPDSRPPAIYFEHQEDEHGSNHVHEIKLDPPAHHGVVHSASPRSGETGSRNSPIKSFQVISKPGTPVSADSAHDDPVVATDSFDSLPYPAPVTPLATHSQPTDVMSPRREEENASVAFGSPQTPDSPQVSSQPGSQHESFESHPESQHDAHHDSTEAQPESQPDSRPSSRLESRPESSLSRASSRQESRPESQSSVRQPESRPESRSDSRTGSRADSRVEVRLGTSHESLVRVSRESSQNHARTDPRPDSRSEIQLGMSHDSMQSEPESQADSLFEVHHDSSHDSHPESQPASRPESRTSSRPESHSGSRPASRSDSHSTSVIELSPEVRPESRSMTPGTPESHNESRPESRFDWRPESRLDWHLESQTNSPASVRSESRSERQPESQPEVVESPPESPYKPQNPNQNPPPKPYNSNTSPRSLDLSSSSSTKPETPATEPRLDLRPDSPPDHFNDLDTTFHEDLKLNLSKHINKDLKGSYSNMEPEQHTTRRITPRAGNSSPLHAKFSTIFDISMGEEPEGEEQEEIEPEPQPSDTEPESENDLEPELESESLLKARQRSDPRRATTPKRSPLIPRATTPKRAARTPTPKQPKPEPEPEPDPFSDPEAESSPQRELEHSAEFGSEFDPESQPESESELDGDASPLPRSAITSPMEFHGHPSPLPPTLALSPALPTTPYPPTSAHQPPQSPESPSPDELESPLRQGLAQLEGHVPKV